MIKEMNINDMSCGHCEKSVKEALYDLEGVKKVDVDLETKKVVVEGDNLENQKIIDAIDEIGFEVSNLK